MNKYIIIYYNRFACQTQTFRVIARNEFHAGRLFYRMHDRKSYHACIESICRESDRHYYTEEEIMKAIENKKRR